MIGADAFWTYLTSVRAALADYRCEILECVSEEDAAFAKMRLSGTHVGAFRGFPPTGGKLEWLGAAHFVIRSGRIARIWVLGDLVSLDENLRENARCFRPPSPPPA